MADTIVATIDQLEKTDSSRRELVAAISHDLRSPLTSMSGFLELLLAKEDTLSAEQRRHYLHQVSDSVQKQKRLVNDLFELSKLEARESLPDFELAPLEELTHAMELKYKETAAQKSISLKCDSPDELPLSYCDVTLLGRVFSNLIENALTYTDAGGEICIVLRESNGKISVELSDTGCGIPAEDLPHIFDAFYRASNEQSLLVDGTGLGLAIVKKILEAHGEDIAAESVLGEGTTFRFHVATGQRQTLG